MNDKNPEIPTVHDSIIEALQRRPNLTSVELARYAQNSFQIRETDFEARHRFMPRILSALTQLIHDNVITKTTVGAEQDSIVFFNLSEQPASPEPDA